MATFGPIESSFLHPNELMVARYGNQIAADAHQNSLLNQQATQQAMGTHEIEYLARASQSLLGLGDEAKMAEAYPEVVRSLQAQGLAKNAPPQFPGRAALERIAALGTPSATLGQRAEERAGLGALLGTPGPQSSAAPAGGGGGGFGPALASSESGGRYDVVNNEGFAGKYQMGKQRLASLGYYQPAPGEDMNDRKNWQGKVVVPGFAVTDQASFLKNPAAQEAVFGTHLTDVDKTIAATPGADKFDPNGLRAVYHLGGPGGMRKFVESGGEHNPADSNGTSLRSYYQKFSGGGVAARNPGSVDVAGPGAPTGEAAGGILSKYTPEQQTRIRASRTVDKALEQMKAFDDDNRMAAAQVEGRKDKEFTQAMAIRSDRRAEEAAQLARDRLEQDKTEGGAKISKNQFEMENTLRDEFQKLTSDFRIVQTSYENIRSAAKANDGAGDMSMLYNYVRLLDPTSVVRESEFAAAAASGSFGQRVQGAVERVLSGARMPESLRQSFIREGGNLYENQRKSHDTVATQYEALAKRNGLEPDKVVTRFDRPQGDAGASTPKVIRYDHQGNRVTE